MQIPEHWTFRSKEVASSFDAHVREQLPWYALATDGVSDLVRQYLPPNGVMYDVGAATGNISKSCRETLTLRNASCVSIEESSEMVSAWDGFGDIKNEDMRTFSWEPFDVAVCFLSLMFIPQFDQRSVLEKLLGKRREGGAVIVVERFEPESLGYVSLSLSRLTLSAKLKSGASANEIIEKELSLRGIQRPVNCQMMRSFGGTEWFRFSDFAGFIL